MHARRQGDVSNARVFAEFERAIIVERVEAGLSRARSQGKQLGRPTLPPEKEADMPRLL